jgi:hypothetical protein
MTDQGSPADGCAGLALGKTHNGQEAKTAQCAAPVMPATYMNSSASEHEEEVHLNHYAQACGPLPVFTRVQSLAGPFTRKVVQSAKPDQSGVDYLGISAQLFF